MTSPNTSPSYRADASLKKRFVAQLRANQKAGRVGKTPVDPPKWRGGPLANGVRILEGLGRAPLEGAPDLASELGVPEYLLALQEAIFWAIEPHEDAEAWPARFFSALPVGKHLLSVGHNFIRWAHTSLPDPRQEFLDMSSCPPSSAAELLQYCKSRAGEEWQPWLRQACNRLVELVSRAE